MVLFFLLLLCFLIVTILAELERGGETPAAATDCPGCLRSTEPDWLVCPACRRLLLESCGGCGRLHGVRDAFCPWCGQGCKGGG